MAFPTSPTKRSSRPSSSKRKSSKHSPQKQKGNWVLTTLGLTAIALLSATAGALLAFSMASIPLGQSKLTPAQSAVFNKAKTISYQSLNLPQLSRPINILVLGTKVLTSDVGDNSAKTLGYQALVNSLSGLTDTMMLIRLDPEKEKLTVVSLPRDTQVEIEGHGLQKINEANAYGGPSLAAETVSHLLGDVPIDRYVRVNVQAVEKLVDALGGVTVYVPKNMKYQDDSQHLYINLQEGQQHLDGNKTLQLLRFRHDQLGDIGRIQRQQMVSRAIIEQALKPQTLLKIPDVLSIVQSHIDTNVNLEELIAIAGFAAQTQRSNVQMLMLPGNFNSNGRTETSYWLPDAAKIQTLVTQYFGVSSSAFSSLDNPETVASEPEQDPSKLRIAIQDSTNNPAAVQSLVRTLNEVGYRRVYVVEHWRQPLATTRIVAPNGNDLGASQVRASLGIGEVLVDSNGYLVSDVTIQVGQDWVERRQQGN